MATGWSARVGASLCGLAVLGAPGAVRAADVPQPGWEDDAPIDPLPPPPRPVVHPSSHADALRAVLRNHPEIGPRYRSARGMVIGGASGMGAGAAILLTAGVLALDGIEPVDGEPSEYAEAREARKLARGVAIGGGLVFAVAVTVLGIGLARREQAYEDAERRVRARFTARGLALRF